MSSSSNLEDSPNSSSETASDLKTIEERIADELEKHRERGVWNYDPKTKAVKVLCICGQRIPAAFPDNAEAFAAHSASAVAPIVREAQAEALMEAAADTKARGDIGKDGGVEAWDYLTWRADRIGKGEGP